MSACFSPAGYASYVTKSRSYQRLILSIFPQTATTLTTNDIVINKLTQILSYLRQGRHGRRLKKKDKQRAAEEKKIANEDIYGELGDYVPAPAKKDREREKEREREKTGERG